MDDDRERRLRLLLFDECSSAPTDGAARRAVRESNGADARGRTVGVARYAIHIAAICGHRRADVGRQHDRRPLTRGEVLGLLGPPLEPPRLLVRERPNEHLRETHHHLPDRDASRFATAGEFPVKPSEKGH
jgi:hypothetical protein